MAGNFFDYAWGWVTPWDTQFETTEKAYQQNLAAKKKAEEEAAARRLPIQGKIDAASAKIDQLPGFTDWMASQGNTVGTIDSQLTGLGGLRDQLMAGPDVAGGQQFAAQMGGFDDFSQMQQAMQGMYESAYGRRDAEGNVIEGQGAMDLAQGMSAEDMALREKQVRRNTMEMERRAERMLGDVMSDTGSTARMFAQADEYLNSIANAEVQQQVQIAQDNIAMKIQEVQGAQQGYAQQYQQGTMSAIQFMQTKQQGLGLAMQAYAIEMEAIMTNNNQYLQQYQADYNAVLGQINSTLAAAQLEMGLTDSEINWAAEQYAAEIQPRIDALNEMAMQQELTFGFDDIWDAALVVLPTALGFILGGPAGAAIGGAIGSAIQPPPPDYSGGTSVRDENF